MKCVYYLLKTNNIWNEWNEWDVREIKRDEREEIIQYIWRKYDMRKILNVYYSVINTLKYQYKLCNKIFILNILGIKIILFPGYLNYSIILLLTSIVVVK